MSKKYITNLFLIVILILIAFFTGFFYARRELTISSKDSIVRIKNENGFVDNLFSNIKQKPINGLFDGSTQVYGDMFYIIIEDKTQILFSLDNIPVNTKFKEKIVETPMNYKVFIAVKCCKGLDYEYKDYDIKLNLLIENGKARTNFSTNFDFNLEESGVQRIVLFAEGVENNYKIIKDEQKDWPKNTLENPAPYLWINF